MSFVTRSVGTLALSLTVAMGCGGGDSGTFGGGSGGGKSSGGAQNDASAGGKGAGGKTSTGSKTSAGGSTGGDGGDAASTGGSDASSGGTDGGVAGAGGAAAGAGGAAGASAGGAGGAGGKKPNKDACAAGTECISGNCVGGTCCAAACNTPGLCQKQTGTVCLNGDTCQYGLLADKTPCDNGDKCAISTCFDGECQVDSAKNCSDGNACTDDLCNSATGACSHPATNCDDKNPCTTDSCDNTQGCLHTDNTAACTDNNPCTTDKCSGGVCVSTPKDCSSLDDDCHKGTCVSGNCQAQAANASGPCAIGLTACDTAGTCNASGTCVGDDDGCGPLSTSCATCTTGVNCHAGRDCTCATANPPNVVSSAGMCVPNTDECAAVPSPCSSLATCRDPSTAAGDVICTCPKGYTGNGKGASGCVDINECSPTNSCGSGGTCTNTAGTYTCACAAGFKNITTATGPKCVCDLSGTYGLVVTTNVTWTSPNPAIEASPQGGVPIYSWTLRYNTVAADGKMTSTTIPCGGTSPTFCDTAFGFAHAQFQPDATWGKKKVNDGFAPFTMSLAGVVPGAAAGAYSEPQTVSLQGIALDNPAGEWPACAACVGVAVGGTCTCGGTQHTVTNKATWVDAETDSHLGFTTETVPRGGQAIGSPYIIDNSVADPPFDYVEPSECPRTTSGTKYNYAEFPGLVGLLPFRAYRWYAASRVISAYASTSITLSNNSCQISGNVTGPDSGKPHGDARVQGCEICKDDPLDPSTSTSCQPGGPCSPAQVSSYDDLSQTQNFVSTTFTLKNVTASINLASVMAMTDGPAKETALNQACQQLRVQNCPSGKSCQ